MYRFQKWNHRHRSGHFSPSPPFQKYNNQSNNQNLKTLDLEGEAGEREVPPKKICLYKEKDVSDNFKDNTEKQIRYVQKTIKYKEKVNSPVKYVEKPKIKYIQKQNSLSMLNSGRENKEISLIEKGFTSTLQTQKKSPEDMNQEEQQLQEPGRLKNSKSETLNNEQDDLKMCSYHYSKMFLRSLSKRKQKRAENIQNMETPEFMGVILKIRQVNCKEIKIHTMVDHNDQRIQTYNFQDKFDIRKVNRKQFFIKQEEKRQWRLAESRYPLRVSLVKLRCMTCGMMHKCLLSHFVYTAKTCQRCVSSLQFEVKGGQMIKL